MGKQCNLQVLFGIYFLLIPILWCPTAKGANNTPQDMVTRVESGRLTVPVLRKALEDRNGDIREAAADAIEEIEEQKGD